jgi:glycosyltransferase involved in cell wall biosynthesis
MLKHFLFEGHSVISLSWAHDISYHVPDVDEQYYYCFEAISPNDTDGPISPREYKIPVMPLLKGLSDPVPIYEAINLLEPDIVITIGNLVEAAFMKAVKTFVSKPFKWMAVLAQSQYPISDELSELMDYMDGVLCASHLARDEIEQFFQKPYIEASFVDCDERFFREEKRDLNKFRVMALGKSSQADNLPMIMEVCSELRQAIPELELYIHANICDQGEYNLETVRKRFDPDNEFIRFPDKFVSLVEGISTDELAEEYAKADVFVSIPLVSATSMSVWEAMASGCFPIMSDCGSNRDLVEKLEKKEITEFSRDSLLVPGIKLMTVGETYLTVSNPVGLKKRLLWMHKNREKMEGYREELSVFSKQDSKQAFIEVLAKMIKTLETSNEVLSLETL